MHNIFFISPRHSKIIFNYRLSLCQLPALDYDGLKISRKEETPIILYSLKNKKTPALDPNNKLMPADRAKLSIIRGTQKLIVNLIESDGSVRNTLPIEYTQIFGNNPQILTQEVIKSSFAQIVNKAPSVFIYLIFPVTAFLIFRLL